MPARAWRCRCGSAGAAAALRTAPAPVVRPSRAPGSVPRPGTRRRARPRAASWLSLLSLAAAMHSAGPPGPLVSSWKSGSVPSLLCRTSCQAGTWSHRSCTSRAPVAGGPPSGKPMHRPLFVFDISVEPPPGKCHRCGAPSDAYPWQWESCSRAPAAVLPPGTSTHMVLPLPLPNGRKISFQALAGPGGSEACAVAGHARAPTARPPGPARPRRAGPPSGAFSSGALSWMSVRVHPLSAPPCNAR